MGRRCSSGIRCLCICTKSDYISARLSPWFGNCQHNYLLMRKMKPVECWTRSIGRLAAKMICVYHDWLILVPLSCSDGRERYLHFLLSISDSTKAIKLKQTSTYRHIKTLSKLYGVLSSPQPFRAERIKKACLTFACNPLIIPSWPVRQLS